jgi:hypothetical protein
MAVIHGVAHWPGAVGCVSCTYTCSLGTSPGVATLEIPEQAVNGIASAGTLTIEDGRGGVQVRRARVQSIDFPQSGDAPRTVLLQIVDRRWQWQYGRISGAFNQFDAHPDPESLPDSGESSTRFTVFGGGPFVPGTFRPAFRLMEDCLRAMGEDRFLIVDPPNVAVPVRWEDEVPAAALDGVCEALGYVVAYQPGADRVLVCPEGNGALLPANVELVSASPQMGLPQRPSSILLVGGPTVFTDRLFLEPVGMEPNGAVVPIDDLTYAPLAGWANVDPGTFGGVRGTEEISEKEAIELAKRCVWRLFRVKMVDQKVGMPGGPNVVGFGLVRDRRQIVLLPQRFLGSNDLEADGTEAVTPPNVTGSIYLGAFAAALGNVDIGPDGNSLTGRRLPRVPSIDSARGLVTFDQQCFRKEKRNGVIHILSPELLLHTSFNVLSPVGRVPAKFERGGAVGGVMDTGCPPQVLRHPELFQIIVVFREQEGGEIAPGGVGDNLDRIIPAADFHLTAADRRWEATAAASATYAGIVPINPDGSIRQVTWKVGNGPATTTASQNSEHDPFVPPFPERRRITKSINFLIRDGLKEKEKQKPNPDSPGAEVNLPVD